MINISIVLYKNEYLEVNKCLSSLINSRVINRIYLLDNSPTNCLSSLSSLSPLIIYIHNQNNLGFGRAHNIYIKSSLQDNIKYHLILNADCYFENYILDNLIKFMDANPKIGLVSPKIFYPNYKLQTLCKLLPSPLTVFFRRFLPGSLAESINRKYELHDFDYMEELDVPSLSGCFMFFRTFALKVVGSFDEKFFLYAEDLDLCRRVNVKFRTVFFPDVYIFHKYNKGSYRKLNLLTIHIISMIKYFNKWGWFFDAHRTAVNSLTIQEVKNRESLKCMITKDSPNSKF